MATKTTPAVQAEARAWGTQKSQHDKNRISGADGIRALAALSVIGHHLFQKLAAWEQAPWLQEVHAVVLKGAVGVSVFFVLSGMLLSMPFWMAFFEKRSYPRIGHYIKRRAERIVPGFYVALLVSFWVGSLYFDYSNGQVLDPVRRLVAGLTFTSGLHYETLFPTEVNGPLWSISFEVISYVLMPLVMIGLFVIGRRTRARWAGWTYWLVALAVVLVANHLLVSTVQLSDEGRGWDYGLVGGAKFWMPGYNPLGFFAHFAIGILVAAFIAQWRVFHDSRRSWWFDLGALAAASAIAVALWLIRYPAEPGQDFSLDNQPYYYPTFAVLVGLLLACLAYSKVLGRLFDNPFFAYTAKVSFGLYIWHHLILFIVEQEVYPTYGYGGVTDPYEFLVVSLLVLGASYAVAAASWALIERPVLEERWRSLSFLRQRPSDGPRVDG